MREYSICNCAYTSLLVYSLWNCLARWSRMLSRRAAPIMAARRNYAKQFPPDRYSHCISVPVFVHVLSYTLVLILPDYWNGFWVFIKRITVILEYGPIGLELMSLWSPPSLIPAFFQIKICVFLFCIDIIGPYRNRLWWLDFK